MATDQPQIRLERSEGKPNGTANEVLVFPAVNISDEFCMTNTIDKSNSSKSDLDELLDCDSEDKRKVMSVNQAQKGEISTPSNNQAIRLLTVQNLKQLQRRYAVGAPLSDMPDLSNSKDSLTDISCLKDNCSKAEFSDMSMGDIDWRYEEKKNELNQLEEFRNRVDERTRRAKHELLQLERMKRKKEHYEQCKEQNPKALRKKNRPRNRGGYCRDILDTLDEEIKKEIEPLNEKYTNLMQKIMETNGTTNHQDNWTTIQATSAMEKNRIDNEDQDISSRFSLLTCGKTKQEVPENDDTYKRFLTCTKAQKRINRHLKRMPVAKPNSTKDLEFSCPSRRNKVRIQERKNLQTHVRKIEKLRTPFLAQRAKYQGSMRADDLSTNLMNQESKTVTISNPSLPAQFVSIAGPKNSLKTDETKARATELTITRIPICCPDAYCQAKSFMSDFNRHLLFGHHGFNMERIEVNQTKTFFLDPTLLELNMPKCHMLYLLKDKIVDPHSKMMSDLMPIMVMATRANLVQIYCPDLNVVSAQSLLTNPSSEVVLIWLTSLKPNNMNISGTICACPSTQMHSAELLFVLTSQVYDITHEHTIEKLGRSSATLMLSNSCFNEMTRNGNDMICIQVQMH